jgi:inosine-uridine nucleoside N-ribohydrolase
MTDNCSRIPVIIDTDPGTDDAAAILWVLANEKFDVKAVTVADGNVGMERGAANSRDVLNICGRTDIPVYLGWENLTYAKTAPAYGADGMQGRPKYLARKTGAPREMIRIAKWSRVPVTILALAPLTNVACALLLDPGFLDNVGQVLFMGSAACALRPSFNGDSDPEAAEIVCRSGIRMTEICPDVCDCVRQTEKDICLIGSSGTRAAQYLINILSSRNKSGTGKNFYPGGGRNSPTDRQIEDGICLHDLACAAYLIEPGWFKTRRLTDRELFADPDAAQNSVHTNIFSAFDADGRAAMDRWVRDMRSFDTHTD